MHVRSLGPGHEDTATATRELGKVLAQQGQAEEAEKLLRRALTVRAGEGGRAAPACMTRDAMAESCLGVHLGGWGN